MSAEMTPDNPDDKNKSKVGFMGTPSFRYMFTIFVLVLVADQITKQIMLDWIFAEPQLVRVAPFLNFVPVWNPGMSFGMLADGGAIVRYGLTLLAVLVAGWLLWQHAVLSKAQIIAGGLIAGGAIGNAIDRLRFGKVVDFIDVYVQGWHWPAFNIADAGITVGALLWAYSIFVGQETSTS